MIQRIFCELLFLAAAGLIIAGVARLTVPGAMIVGGGLLAGYAFVWAYGLAERR